MKSPAQITNGILAHLVAALLLVALMPPAIVALVTIRAIEAIADSRAWAAFARFWWGVPHGW